MSNRLAGVRCVSFALMFALSLGAGTSASQEPSGQEDRERLARSPRQVAEQLAVVYGKKLDQVAYIPALPLVAKLRLGELTRQPKYAEEVDKIVAPFLRGDKSPVPKSGSAQAGHLIFAELALRTTGKDRERWTLLCRNAADQIFGKDGKPLPIMPFHSEMSDAVFMAGPILAATGNLTGEQKYFDAAVTHFASMRKLCVRRDGLYRHSPLCEAARGARQRLPGSGPRARVERLARRPSRAEGADRRIPEAHGGPQAPSGRQDRLLASSDRPSGKLRRILLHLHDRLCYAARHPPRLAGQGRLSVVCRSGLASYQGADQR
jgi:hypothetical protein